MSRVHIITYQVIGSGLNVAAEHYAAVDAASKAHWEFVEQVGGKGFRPSHGGGLRSVFFADIPPGWRKIGRHGANVEAVPHRGSAQGKALAKQIADLDHGRRGRELAYALGYNPKQLAMDSERGTIYFPTDVRVTFPAERIFVRIPRCADDGFEPDKKMLREVRESEFMEAVEDHNAQARLERQAVEDA